MGTDLIYIAVETLASLRHAYLGSFFLDPEYIRKLSIGATWNFVNP